MFKNVKWNYFQLMLCNLYQMNFDIAPLLNCILIILVYYYAAKLIAKAKLFGY